MISRIAPFNPRYTPKKSGRGTQSPSLIIEPDSPVLEDFFGPLTINGITVDPDFIYLGKDATISGWPAYQYGSDLTIAGAGADVVPNQTSNLLGNLNGGVLYKDAKYHVASESIIYDITTQDFIFECVCKVPSTFTALEAICGKYKTNNGYTLAFDTNGKPYLYIKDGTDAVSIISTSGYTANAILQIMVIVDYHGYGIIYINGVAAGSAIDISSVDSLTNGGTFSIGNNTSGGSYAFNSIVYSIAMWKRASWLDSHLQQDLATKRTAQVVSMFPHLALGTALPEVI